MKKNIAKKLRKSKRKIDKRIKRVNFVNSEGKEIGRGHGVFLKSKIALSEKIGYR